MSDTERLLGRLEEFKRSTEKKLDRLERKVDLLTAWKWKSAGALGVLVTGFEVVKMWLIHQPK